MLMYNPFKRLKNNLYLLIFILLLLYLFTLRFEIEDLASEGWGQSYGFPASKNPLPVDVDRLL